jgi:hypothetical protein
LILQPISFHNFEIVLAANDYQASFPAARRNFLPLRSMPSGFCRRNSSDGRRKSAASRRNWPEPRRKSREGRRSTKIAVAGCRMAVASRRQAVPTNRKGIAIKKIAVADGWKPVAVRRTGRPPVFRLSKKFIGMAERLKLNQS